MSLLLGISSAIDALNGRIAVLANFLVLAAALVCAFNAFVRYGLNALIALSRNQSAPGPLESFIAWYGYNSNSLLEAQWYLFAAMVMLGAAYTMRVNEHVRVDLFYRASSERGRAWIDLLGGLFFLLPMCAVMIAFTWPWFIEAFRNGETSPNTGGLIRWPVKLMLPLGFALVALQGVSEIIKSAAVLIAGYRRDHVYETPLQ